MRSKLLKAFKSFLEPFKESVTDAIYAGIVHWIVVKGFPAIYSVFGTVIAWVHVHGTGYLS